jgi:hypothetical protein
VGRHWFRREVKAPNDHTGCGAVGAGLSRPSLPGQRLSSIAAAFEFPGLGSVRRPLLDHHEAIDLVDHHVDFGEFVAGLQDVASGVAVDQRE